MNPIVLYPQNAADAKFFRESAKKRGAKPTRLSSKLLEKLDEIMFAERMIARETGELVSEEEMQALIKRKRAGK